jgi:hypothetical protein
MQQLPFSLTHSQLAPMHSQSQSPSRKADDQTYSINPPLGRTEIARRGRNSKKVAPVSAQIRVFRVGMQLTWRRDASPLALDDAQKSSFVLDFCGRARVARAAFRNLHAFTLPDATFVGDTPHSPNLHRTTPANRIVLNMGKKLSGIDDTSFIPEFSCMMRV